MLCVLHRGGVQLSRLLAAEVRECMSGPPGIRGNRRQRVWIGTPVQDQVPLGFTTASKHACTIDSCVLLNRPLVLDACCLIIFSTYYFLSLIFVIKIRCLEDLEEGPSQNIVIFYAAICYHIDEKFRFNRFIV